MTTTAPERTAPIVTVAPVGVVAGVDTHKDTHHVAVLAATGARLGDLKVPATPAGYKLLLAFVTSYGPLTLVGLEGTNSYGAGLARFLTAAGVPIREVIRPNRAQRQRGKSDRSTPTRLPNEPSPSPRACRWPRPVTGGSSRSGSC